MLPVPLLSSILGNTTVVALFIDVVKMWSRKLHISPSRLLIPLSRASSMGGICTLIGTPPNQPFISSFYAKETGVQLNIFIPSGLGLYLQWLILCLRPCAAVSCARGKASATGSISSSTGRCI